MNMTSAGRGKLNKGCESGAYTCQQPLFALNWPRPKSGGGREGRRGISQPSLVGEEGWTDG